MRQQTGKTAGIRFFAAALTVVVLLFAIGAGSTVNSYAAARFTLSGETYPTTLTAGSSFSITGTLTGTNAITRVEVGVTSQSTGQYVSGYHFDAAGLNTKTYNIANADSALKFGQLPAGSYYYQITAYDKQGAEEVLKKPFTVSAATTDTGKRGWKQEGGYWYYYGSNGTPVTSKWMKDSKGWCYLGSDGRMVAGGWAEDSHGWVWMNSSGYWDQSTKWLKYDGGWYHITNGYRDAKKWMKDSKGWCYLSKDGRMVAKGWTKDSRGWVWMNSSGYWDQSTKWLKYDGGWYHITNGYRDADKWMKDSKGWCYLDKDGRMVANGWAKDSHGWVWMNSSGYWHKTEGWIKDGSEWYFIKSNGYRAARMWLKDSKGWCYAGKNGKLVKNGWAQDRTGWAWMDASGYWAKASKWLKADGAWYFIKTNGYRAANEWARDSKGWCWLGTDGKMVKDQWIEWNGQKYYLDANGYWDTSANIQGFPASYQSALSSLQLAHPNWVFIADNTGVSWSDLLAKEKVAGRNLVEPTSSAAYMNTSNTTIYDGRWRQASDKAIAYYLDPRNFLTERGIYQFLDQRSSVNAGTRAQVQRLVSSNTCFMNTPAYITALVNAGKNSGVNPAVLTATVIGEQGWRGTSDLISGKNSTYPGIYNHFNVGAFTANGMTAIIRGLWWANGAGTGATSFGRPWNTIEKSLTGGAMHYSSGYIKNNQYTYHTKKFNVMNGTSNVGSHQYMTNVEGAYTESLLVKGAFAGDNEALVFHIPVYSNMPAPACPAP